MCTNQTARFPEGWPACNCDPMINGTIFLEVCLHRWRTTRSATAASIIAPRLLRGPRNASDARTLQERALIFLRQLCSPYKTVYCANNKCEAYLQSHTLAD